MAKIYERSDGIFVNAAPLKTYTSVDQLELTAGSATVAAVWAALPVDSVLICASSDISSPPATGTVEIAKKSGTAGWISCHAADGSLYRMGLNSSNAPDGTWTFADLHYYKAGDTMTYTDVPLAGFVTPSTGSISFPVTVPYSLERISSITVDTCVGGIRGISGYVNGSNDNTNWKTSSGVTVSASKKGPKMIVLTIAKSTAFTNVTNNTPVAMLADLKFTFN